MDRRLGGKIKHQKCREETTKHDKTKTNEYFHKARAVIIVNVCKTMVFSLFVTFHLIKIKITPSRFLAVIEKAINVLGWYIYLS